MNTKDQKKDAMLKRERDVIEEHKVANKQLKQTIQDKDEVNTRMKAEISKFNQENEELARQLAEAQKMHAHVQSLIAQTSSHQEMKHQIDIQNKGTNETVSYDAGPKKKLYKLQELLQMTKTRK